MNESSSTTSNSYGGILNSRRSSTGLNSENKIQKIKSLMSISVVSLNEAKNLKAKQDIVTKEVGPEFGFDLTKIRYHYDHRRKMRATHESLRHGNLIYLNVFDINNEPHFNVFAFARHCNEETGIIVINFNDQTATFKLDLKALLPLFDQEINFNSICYIEDWITEERGDFYFIREIISEYHTRTINVLNY